MKNKKSLVAIIAVLLVAIIGGTFAYFQSTGSFVNIFQTGTYRLVTTEVFESPDNWKPGEEIEKTIVTKNEGTIPAAVRVSYTEQWLDGETDITNSIEEGSVIINFDNTNEWIEENGYYYYKYILAPGQTTSSFIKSVTLNEDLDEVTCTTEGLTQVCEAGSPALSAKYILTITKETVQADKYIAAWDTNVEITEKTLNTVTILSGTKGNLQPGDMVGIGETEDFYVLSSDNSSNGKTVLLAKYDLLVGNIYTKYGATLTGQIQPNDEGYGLQSEEVVGYSILNDWKGTVAFSTTNYWFNDDELISPYNKNNTIYYDSDEDNYKLLSNDNVVYPYVYDENSSVYSYISGGDGYINTLISMGAPETITGRLLSYEEAYENQSVLYNNKSIIFNDQSYWLGSTSNNNRLIGVIRDGYINFGDIGFGSEYYRTESYGVRPVIEIYTKDIG